MGIKATAAHWMKDRQKTLDPQIKGEVGVTDQGGNKTYRNFPKERHLKHTPTPSSTQNRKRREPADGADSLKNTQPPWAEELQPSYKVSQLTDCSQLRENITGAPESFWLPVT